MDYGIGALGLGFADRFAGSLDAAFCTVVLSITISAIVLLWLGGGTHPRLNPTPCTNATYPESEWERRA